MFRGQIYSSQICHDKDIRRNQMLHLKRLTSIKKRKKGNGTLDNRVPLVAEMKHLKKNLKKEQTLYDLQRKIDRENAVLLQNMINMSAPSSPTKVSGKNRGEAVEKRSLNSQARKREIDRIDQENKAIANRLIDSKPIYDHKSWNKNRHDVERYIKNMKNHVSSKPYPLEQALGLTKGTRIKECPTARRTAKETLRPISNTNDTVLPSIKTCKDTNDSDTTKISKGKLVKKPKKKKNESSKLVKMKTISSPTSVTPKKPTRGQSSSNPLSSRRAKTIENHGGKATLKPEIKPRIISSEQDSRPSTMRLFDEEHEKIDKDAKDAKTEIGTSVTDFTTDPSINGSDSKDQTEIRNMDTVDVSFSNRIGARLNIQSSENKQDSTTTKLYGLIQTAESKENNNLIRIRFLTCRSNENIEPLEITVDKWKQIDIDCLLDVLYIERDSESQSLRLQCIN